ncbi:enoyl-CoA hydratase-related protein [Frankia sp. AiPs1]|uniref:enoyl-CoA hydratase-related protein n=1 Tax=Frankia sp. AiPs1 TaxID=573493 RepID=UPI002042CA42|nr:enoyl-CoA hydratase-related protein [Frankia sp. AiPs1]MCM3924733.1 enoyl-CoA hydratase-related protein [Frankia sp. AiPs1]
MPVDTRTTVEHGDAPVRYDVADQVATITFDRPDKLNALTVAMGDRLFALLQRADADPRVRAVVITGAGRAFSAGADLAMLAHTPVDGRDSLIVSPENGPAMIRSLRLPVIAAINGPAAGLAFAVSLAADVRFVAADAKLSLPFSRLGLYSEYGSAWLLPRLIGAGAAADLLLSGRVFLGTEAGELGLAQRVLPAAEVLPAALDYARDLALNCSPDALAVIRSMIDDAAVSPLAAHYAATVPVMRAGLRAFDFDEGVAARREKRPPQFRERLPGGSDRPASI